MALSGFQKAFWIHEHIKLEFLRSKQLIKGLSKEIPARPEHTGSMGAEEAGGTSARAPAEWWAGLGY